MGWNDLECSVCHRVSSVKHEDHYIDSLEGYACESCRTIVRHLASPEVRREMVEKLRQIAVHEGLEDEVTSMLERWVGKRDPVGEIVHYYRRETNEAQMAMNDSCGVPNVAGPWPAIITRYDEKTERAWLTVWAPSERQGITAHEVKRWDMKSPPPEPEKRTLFSFQTDTRPGEWWTWRPTQVESL